MKRIGYILVTLVYVALTAGVVLQWSDCCRLERVTVAVAEVLKCGDCQPTTPTSPCCSDETDIWQLSDEQVVTTATPVPRNTASWIAVLPTSVAVPLYIDATYSYTILIDAPPDSWSVDILLREHRLLI